MREAFPLLQHRALSMFPVPTNARVGGMETVLEEGDVGNTEAQPEEHPNRTFKFGRRKGMLERFLECHELTSRAGQAPPC
jgi:hypothetical protein